MIICFLFAFVVVNVGCVAFVVVGDVRWIGRKWNEERRGGVYLRRKLRKEFSIKSRHKNWVMS